ncbi:helix-hairpin-helix domain-containing protein [Dactylosporangium sp. NPDC051541]|uniref:helix-hairpin-helix domain-containing protein n=1 Tax=Dactylosporangium sp. NPDC051541 TaxID=3363977 RepID=UPI00378B7213
MVWYTGQSLLLILLAFLLGLLVGYLWWGLRLRRVRSSSSESITSSSPAASSSASSSVTASAAEPAPVTAAPIAAALADPEPVAEPAPSPVVLAEHSSEPEPVVEEPVVELEPEPVVEAEPVVEEPVAVEPVAVEPVAVESEPVVEAADSEPEPVDAALVADVESAFAAEEEPAPADELERIEGIGPKIAAALRAAGISTYSQLAAADRGELENALERANLRFAPSIGTWSQQARLLADGDEAGFKALTTRLIAGREVTAKTPVAEPEPVVEEPAPVVEEPAPVVVTPEPVAVEPEPEPDVEDPEPVVEEPFAAEPEPVVAEAPVVVPAQAVAVENVEPDNLRRIEGIGPKMSAALIAGGIRTYRQLADADVDTLRSMIEAAGLRFAPSIVTWARQARHLADGDEEGFADLTRRLVAGRDTGRS